MPSPTVQVKDGAGAYGATTNGVNVTAGATITIKLTDTSARSWSIACITTDELSVAATVNAGLTINTTAQTATFTAPIAGRAYRFQSIVNGGIGPDGTVQATYSTTFCIYTLTAASRRVMAADETTEGGPFGWIASNNDLIRNPTAGSSTPWHNVPRATKTANYTVVSTDYLVVCKTNTGFTITLPASPSDGDTYVVANKAAGTNTVSGNGHNINGAATIALVQWQSITFTYDSNDTTWTTT